MVFIEKVEDFIYGTLICAFEGGNPKIIRCPYRCLSALIFSSQSNSSHLKYSNKEQIQYIYLIKDSIIMDVIIAQ